MSEETNQGNPTNAGSSDNFFEAMDRDVNGAILDDQPVQETTLESSGPEMATHNVDAGSQNNNNGVDWEKRYKDSSREATKMREQLQTMTPFVPLLKAMKQDSGLVDTVRGYLTNGGKPAKSIKERLGLKEDFIFDQDQAFSEPDSDSAKLLNSHVDGIVASKVTNIMKNQQQQNAAQGAKQARAQDIAEFKSKNNMSDEQFDNMMMKAKDRKMTLDDVNYLVNRETANQNVANSTKADMMTQMKNVRNIPTTASGVNSPRADKSTDDQIFDDLVGGGQGIEDLFG
jgi:hypothetical protein|tara:strand:- start:1275 stop:2132 length:858 start_codon:yes stop_codon:yes gene_type:complete